MRGTHERGHSSPPNQEGFIQLPTLIIFDCSLPDRKGALMCWERATHDLLLCRHRHQRADIYGGSGLHLPESAVLET